MEKVIMNCIERCDEAGTQVEFTVRGHKVTAIFAAESNQQIYGQIKHILADAYIKHISG